MGIQATTDMKVSDLIREHAAGGNPTEICGDQTTKVQGRAYAKRVWGTLTHRQAAVMWTAKHHIRTKGHTTAHLLGQTIHTGLPEVLRSLRSRGLLVKVPGTHKYTAPTL